MPEHIKIGLLAFLLTAQIYSGQSVSTQTLNTSPNAKHEIEQRNKVAYARRFDELNNLLATASQFPVLYDVSAVPKEQKIVMIMLRHKISEHWHVIDVVHKISLSDPTLKYFWEITPKEQKQN